MHSAPSPQTTGPLRHRPAMRTAAALCLLTAAVALPAQTPATPPVAPPADAATVPPVDAAAPPPAAVATKALPTQPSGKPVSPRQARKASDAFLIGSALLDKNEPEKAQKEFERAASLNPAKQEYALAVAIARENAVAGMVRKAQVLRSTGDNAAAAALLTAAAEIDPQNRLVTEHLPSASSPLIEILPNTVNNNGKLQTLAAPLEFAPDQTTQSFHYRADAHEMMRRVLLAYGLKVQFNPDAPAASTRLDMDNVSFQQVLPVLQQLTGSFIVPLEEKTALVLKDTRENHDHYDHLSLETIYMPGFTTEQMTDAANLLRQVLEIEHVSVNAASGTISIRAPREMLRIANYQLADLLDGGSEVLLDLKIYSISKTNAHTTGLTIPQTVSAYNVAGQVSQSLSQYQTEITALIANGTIPANASLSQIAFALIAGGYISNSLISNTVAFIGGSVTDLLNGKNVNPFTFTGISQGSPFVLNLALNSSEAKSLDEVQLRVGNRQTATFRAGTRYPIITASYSSGITAAQLSGLTSAQLAAYGLTAATAASALTSATVPQIQYEDLGLTLKAIPTVLRSGNVSLAVDLKIEALAGTALNSIPILASRVLTSSITIAPGQTAILVSNLTKQESRAISGLPGLAELPGFQSVTSDDDKNVDTSELLITLTPHLVRNGRDRFASQPISFPRTATKESRSEE